MKKLVLLASLAAVNGSMLFGKDIGTIIRVIESLPYVREIFSSYAVKRENTNRVKELLKARADANKKDSDGWTPLHEAVSMGKPKVVELLINAEADVNAKDSMGRTPLHVVSGPYRKTVAELLLEAGALVNVKDFEGITPLHQAACRYDEDTLSLLLRAGADANAKDWIGRTPLHIVEKRIERIMEMLKAAERK